MRKIRGQLCRLHQKRFFEFSFLTGIPYNDVRPAVVGDVEPEVFRSRDLEFQLVVFSGPLPYQNFPPIDFQRTKPLALPP